jgi:hypothetical protein
MEDPLIAGFAAVGRVPGVGMGIGASIASWPVIGDGATGNRCAVSRLSWARTIGEPQGQARHKSAIIACLTILGIPLSPCPECASRREGVSTSSALPYAELLPDVVLSCKRGLLYNRE